eukprot:6115340-Prymnesium_polylepis.1
MEPVHAALKPGGGFGGAAATWVAVMLVAVGVTALLLATARVLFHTLVSQGGSERNEGRCLLRRWLFEPRQKAVGGVGERCEYSLELMSRSEEGSARYTRKGRSRICLLYTSDAADDM